MTAVADLPYGSWPSPITLDLVLAGGRRLAEPWLDGGYTYLLEGRPDEGGRVTLLRLATDGTVTEITPAPTNVRTRVHEYGGGAWTVNDGLVVVSEFTDGHLVRVEPDGTSRPLTNGTGLRFADMRIDAAGARVLAVMEDHRTDDLDPSNSIVAVALDDGAVTPLVEGGDFIRYPRMSPDGSRLCWLTWDRPNMPWDGSELWIGRLDEDGSVGSTSSSQAGIDGVDRQPRIGAPNGSLVFASDRSGWWNLYRWRPGTPGVEALAPMEAEFAVPQWVFGQRQFGFDGRGRVIAIARSWVMTACWSLRRAPILAELQIDAPDLHGLSVVGDVAVAVARSPTDRRRSSCRPWKRRGGDREASTLALDAGYLSRPRFVEFPTTDGRTAYAFHYPPTNPDVATPDGGTAAAAGHLAWRPDLEHRPEPEPRHPVLHQPRVRGRRCRYGGKPGYGRAYRDRLLGQWGVVDLDDCTHVATWLASQGLADPARLAIRGGSAGGYTTLCALTFRHDFWASTSYFGVGDLAALARDTHKFESRYLDLLVAPWPDGVAVYDERSPIHFVDRIRTPVLVLQGADDRVVPQAQADELVAALARNGVPHRLPVVPGRRPRVPACREPPPGAGSRAVVLCPGVRLHARR